MSWAEASSSSSVLVPVNIFIEVLVVVMSVKYLCHESHLRDFPPPTFQLWLASSSSSSSCVVRNKCLLMCAASVFVSDVVDEFHAIMWSSVCAGSICFRMEVKFYLRGQIRPCDMLRKDREKEHVHFTCPTPDYGSLLLPAPAAGTMRKFYLLDA